MKNIKGFWLMIPLLFASNTLAGTRHTITFGSYFYNPNSLTVAVGDTITWQGNEGFAFHPLESTSVPPGASSFSQSSGTTFSYVVAVAGTYNYECVFHAFPPFSMTGTFSANPTGVANDQTAPAARYELKQNFPNPFNPTTTIHFNIPTAQTVTIKVFNLVGNEIAILVNEKKDPGSYTVEFDGRNLASGIYLYRLEAGNFRETKKLVLMK
jgi:plastocyanin